VSLASVVVHFREGQTPGRIVESFPAVTLARVYGAIACCLENRKLIDGYLIEVEREFNRFVPPLSQSNPELFARLMAAREQMGSRSKRPSASWRTRMLTPLSSKVSTRASPPLTFWM
jgi:hypothetical protein